MSRVVWAFTNRTGGISDGPYGSLNVSLSVGDDPQRVADNRRRVIRQLGISEAVPVAVAAQEHGRRVLRVEGPSVPLGGQTVGGWQVVGRGDALITAVPGQALAVLVADCAPVLLVDERGGWVGAVHAGWRGLAAGVVGQAVAALRRAGAVAGALRALVGPCIRACCYRVGPEVAAAVGRHVHAREDGLFLDVALAARDQLLEAGLVPQRVWVDGRCTACHPELFFSYRRDGPRSGRMAAVVTRLEG